MIKAALFLSWVTVVISLARLYPQNIEYITTTDPTSQARALPPNFCSSFLLHYVPNL